MQEKLLKVLLSSVKAVPVTHRSLYLVQVLQGVHVIPVLTVSKQSCFPTPTEDTTALFLTWYLALQRGKPYCVD